MIDSKSISSTIEKFVDKRVQRLSPLKREDYFQARKARWEDSRAEFLVIGNDRVYSNTGALLTHISAMIAALGILLIVFDESKITQVLILIEISSYTVFAIICVYCLKFKGATPTEAEGDKHLDEMYRIYLSRRYIFRWCSNGVLIVTLLFFLTILGHVFTLIISM